MNKVRTTVVDDQQFTLTDINMPRMDGVDTLKPIARCNPGALAICSHLKTLLIFIWMRLKDKADYVRVPA